MRLFLALGSNEGDRLAHLRFARSEVIRCITASPVRSAGIYESDPVDCPPGSPPFLNTVLAGESTLSPDQLLVCSQSIESAAGRSKTGIRNAPRCLDIDILLLDALVIRTETLSIPHPRLHLRRFVLHPLSELAPHLFIPEVGASVSDLCASFTGEEKPPIQVASVW